MSIDAIINKVMPQPNGDLVLDLIGRTKEAPPGQPRLTILNPTVIPPVGSELWGGSGGALLELGDGLQLKYRREGYTGLIEQFEEG